MNVEWIDDPPGPDGNIGNLVVIVRGGWAPVGTTFHTEPVDQQQVATIRRLPGDKIPAHKHNIHKRETWLTPEVFVVKTGKMILDLYSSWGSFFRSVEVRGGDVVIIKNGGHGIRFLEDTILVEVKQGPYRGRDADKTDLDSPARH